MNVRHRPVHTLPGGGGRGSGGMHGPRPRSRRRLIQVNKDNIGYVAIVSFVLLGLSLFLFFDFHHHEYDIDTGKEVDVDVDMDEDNLDEANKVLSVEQPEAQASDPAILIENKSSEEEADSAAGGASGSGSLRGRGGQGRSSRANGPDEGQDEDNSAKSPRFVTVLLPSVVNPAGRPKRLDSIAATWGPAARAVFVVHDTNEYLNGANNLVGFSADGSHYPQVLLLPEKITDKDGVPRLQHAIRTVHESIDPDFAFFVNDHTFVIPEHLCAFLADHDAGKELYAGHAMKNEKEGYAFNSGAAGYVLSRHTMADLVRKWDENDPKCLAERAAKWLQGNPGLVTAKCLRESMHVNAVDTRNENGRHRFHAFGLVRTVTGHVDEWYLKKHRGLDVIFGPDKHHHQHMPLKGNDCCSTQTVSFHYVEHAETRAMYDVREKLKKNGHMTDDELKNLMVSSWPTGRDLGAYARKLPDANEAEEWSSIISIFRRISSPSADSTPHPLC